MSYNHVEALVGIMRAGSSEELCHAIVASFSDATLTKLVKVAAGSLKTPTDGSPKTYPEPCRSAAFALLFETSWFLVDQRQNIYSLFIADGRDFCFILQDAVNADKGLALRAESVAMVGIMIRSNGTTPDGKRIAGAPCPVCLTPVTPSLHM
jgi:hypothetical protein